MKRFLVLVVLLAMMLATVVPVLAQEPPPFSVTGVVEDLGSGVDGSSPYSIDPAPHDGERSGIYLEGDVNFGAFVGEWVTAYGTPKDVGGFRIVHVTRIEPETATLTFELAVECPPADAEFLGFTALESLVTTPLTDPDGDGLYTGSQKVPRFPPGPRFVQQEPISLSPVRIVQGSATGATALGPQFRLIKDFGSVKLDGDKTLTASVSFCDNGGGTDNNGAGVPGGGALTQDGGAPAQLPATGGAQAQLPATGGVSLLGLGAVAALLVGGGLLARRLTR